jgi:hypothetical protein
VAVPVTVDPVVEEAAQSGSDHTAVLDSTLAQPGGRALEAPVQSDILRPPFPKMMDTFPHGGSRFMNNAHDLLRVNI